MNKSYTSIHNHSDYSNLKLIDSINTVEKLIKKALELGLNGVAITDHDSVSGHVKAWNYYNKLTKEERSKLKLILGNEIYLCRSGLNAENHIKGEKFYHLILLAKNDIGHKQIREISSRAWGRSYMKNIMRTPTYSEDLFEVIGENKGHVIATTACLGGYCGAMYAQGEYENIERHLNLMSELFGFDNFYIELQPSYNTDQINYNRYMLNKYWRRYNFVLSTDSHYLTKEEKDIHKIFLNSKSSGDRETDLFYASAYMMSYDEIKEYFINGTKCTEEQFETMCENTNRIAAQIESYNLKHTSIIPQIKYEKEEINQDFYNNICKKYQDKTIFIQKMINDGNSSDIYMLNSIVQPWTDKVPVEQEEKYVIELDYECEQLYKISEQLGQSMSNYFITMAKMINIMWNEADSIVGPARGSAGSSLINYLLGITQIDPLNQPVELPFWRLANKLPGVGVK